MYCNQCGKQIPGNSIFCNFCGSKVKQTGKSLTREELIINACKDFVEKHLKAPSTVKYNSIEIKEQDQCGRIYLLVELDSQNGFGAHIRSKYQVVLQCVNNDGSYEVGRHAFNLGSANERIIKNSNDWNLPKF